MRRPWFTSVFIFVVVQACVDPVALESIQHDDALVIEGYISSDFKAHQIKLSRTSPLNVSKVIPEKNATVTLKDSEGNIYATNEASPGNYLTTPFAGTIGRRYQLIIATSKNRNYTSDEVVLNDVPEIGRIYAQYPSPEAHSSDGIQIYIDTPDPTGITSYYRWDYEDTYEIQTPQRSPFVWLGGNNVNVRDLPVDRCWHSDTLRRILVKDNSHQAIGGVVKFPIKFIPADSRELIVKYSILVKQYPLSFQAYRFWLQQKQINEGQGSLFDIQPGPVKGNLKSLEDPNETVLGYFDAGVIRSTRVFFVPHDLAESGYQPIDFFGVCGNVNPAVIPFDEIGEYMAINYRTQDIGESGADAEGTYYKVWPKTCCNCTRDGSNIMPDFWQ